MPIGHRTYGEYDSTSLPIATTFFFNSVILPCGISTRKRPPQCQRTLWIPLFGPTWCGPTLTETAEHGLFAYSSQPRLNKFEAVLLAMRLTQRQTEMIDSCHSPWIIGHLYASRVDFLWFSFLTSGHAQSPTNVPASNIGSFYELYQHLVQSFSISSPSKLKPGCTVQGTIVVMTSIIMTTV